MPEINNGNGNCKLISKITETGCSVLMPVFNKYTALKLVNLLN